MVRKNKNQEIKVERSSCDNRDSVDIETVALARKILRIHVLCDAATALLLAATTKKDETMTKISPINMDVSTTRIG